MARDATASNAKPTQSEVDADNGRSARRWTEEEIDQYVEELVRKAPPLTLEQYTKLASIYREDEGRDAA
ncbi:hypothetical protein [Dactylosporangium sp. NPDC051541]|uniref:hypothetical protein n=1 Tax=Dactylosporangium sp. NPDC051541 TaxID=3363977 RepID=UPI0037A7C151